MNFFLATNRIITYINHLPKLCLGVLALLSGLGCGTIGMVELKYLWHLCTCGTYVDNRLWCHPPTLMNGTNGTKALRAPMDECPADPEPLKIRAKRTRFVVPKATSSDRRIIKAHTNTPIFIAVAIEAAKRDITTSELILEGLRRAFPAIADAMMVETKRRTR